MTNHEYFASVTGDDEPVDVESVKMLLARIEDDIQCEIYEANKDEYLRIYKGQKDWLNSQKR